VIAIAGLIFAVGLSLEKKRKGSSVKAQPNHSKVA
jgi:hypothetical protein